MNRAQLKADLERLDWELEVENLDRFVVVRVIEGRTVRVTSWGDGEIGLSDDSDIVVLHPELLKTLDVLNAFVLAANAEAS